MNTEGAPTATAVAGRMGDDTPRAASPYLVNCRHLIPLLCVVVQSAFLGNQGALADEVRVSSGACGAAVHLVARDARFSDVLGQLAQTLHFDLSFESKSDPLINVDAWMSPNQLLARLVPDASISATEAIDPRCPLVQRILKVWVLQSSSGGQPQSPLPQPPLINVRETPEQVRQAQKGIDMYLKGHGFDPSSSLKSGSM
jgi:hypothetical protein